MAWAGNKYMYDFENVNFDGYEDLVIHFRVQSFVDAGKLTNATTSLNLTPR